jgi:hypothetical protein
MCDDTEGGATTARPEAAELDNAIWAMGQVLLSTNRGKT